MPLPLDSMYVFSVWVSSYLVLVNIPIVILLVSLLLEGDNDQGHKDVQEEKGENDEVDHIIQGILNAVVWFWTSAFFCRVY